MFLKGGEGGKELAEEVAKACDIPSRLEFAYELDVPVAEKIEAVAKRIYGADGVDFSDEASKKIAAIEEKGCGSLPVIIAKTQYSLSDNAELLGRPSGFRVTVRDIVLKGCAPSPGISIIFPAIATIKPAPPFKTISLTVTLKPSICISPFFCDSQ